MRVKPVDPNAIVRDPHTKRALPADGGEVPDNVFWNRRWLAGEIWKQDGATWTRRLPSGQIVRERIDAGAPPTGREPIAPLTTRGGK